MRSASIQFGWFTPEEAFAKLRGMDASDMDGDRDALARRAVHLFRKDGMSLVAGLLALQSALDAEKNRRDIRYVPDVR